ncbi:MAG: hypothetical protein LBD11_04305 [Candidatus Peribacteria bacterium]|jgi:uncharacterized protein YpuA (DUF1002 family)|nr:hypothetical protein [Candidatus Peribacteria bacterium]
MREEKKIVTRSLVILFLSLTIVYALAYMRKTDIFTAGQDTQTLDEVSTQLETGNQNTDTAIIDITAMTPNNATGTI